MALTRVGARWMGVWEGLRGAQEAEQVRMQAGGHLNQAKGGAMGVKGAPMWAKASPMAWLTTLSI